MVIAYNPNVGGGLASGVEKLANAFLERKRRQGIASGLEQINGGDWEGGINTISETDPNAALNLTLAKRKSDDAMALEQAKEQARNTMTPYQQEMINLARQRLAQSGGGTGSIKNIEYLVGQGYTPEQAANMVFSGQNPTLDVATLGKKGFEAYDKKTGELLAGKTEAADLLKQTEQAYNDLFKDGGLIQQAKIGADMPDSVAGRVGGIFDRAVPTNLVDKEAQQARQQIQYILGGLRLDESSAMKGALSDSEQKFLSDMVAGNVKGYSPWEIEGAFKGIMNKLRRKAGIGDVQATDEEVIDYTDL